MDKELKIVEQKISGMQKMIEETIVTDDKTLALISDKIKNVKDMGKYVKGLKDKMTAPADLIYEQAKEWFDAPIKQCKNAEEVLKQKAQKYLEDKEAKRIAAEKKIEEDLAKGKIKHVETAVRKLENLPDQQKSVDTGSSGLRMVKRRVVEITDPKLVPEKYWVINETLLKKESMDMVNLGFPPVAGTIIKEVSTMMSVK